MTNIHYATLYAGITVIFNLITGASMLLILIHCILTFFGVWALNIFIDRCQSK